ncbi:carbon-nitrogen hydrolase [Sulfurovum lithotrophicum]|uniref:Carbon-nitrogen hydrolase n=1 Tax=Sulfurovum lithotrophicum TaxID=206403 RepID=A0A7U4LZS3_9BACT|nr:carbon-nitrogen hydrolase [Sulfurovum lithotrophicum]AKF24235.1 carbon-nitrogen hydrolase [Sulfurovum lithotrophicum]
MKTALIQQKFYENKEDTVRATVEKIEEAVSNGAELIVLQELHQNEYFCQSENTAFFGYASDFDADVSFWGDVAKENGIVLVTSLFEKRAPGLYHNTAVVFEKDGSVAGKYRKMHIPDDPGFYEKFYFTPGDMGFEPIDTSVGRLGVLVCWDQWYPEAARIMALKGAQLLIYPTAIGWFDEDSEEEKNRQLESWITIQRSHAIANGIPVLSCNRIGFEPDSSEVLNGIRFWGNSFVCGAQGEMLAQASNSTEEILYADVKHKRTKEVRDIWPFLRDRRIEAYDCLLKRYCD